jgi:heat shock protein HslJ
MRRLLIIATALTLALALAACGAAGAGLDGTRWVLSEIEQDGAGRTPLPGSQITLDFSAGQAGGSSGCNSYSGSYTARGGTIAFEQLASTEMACLEAGRMEQEAAYLQALMAATTFQRDASSLTITGGGTTLRFRPA